MKFEQAPDLMFSRGDSDDPRLGEKAKLVSPAEFSKADWDFAVLGLPDERGILLNKGRPGASKGPNAIRKWFYRLVLPDQNPKIGDLGDLKMTSDLSYDHDEASQAIAFALTHSKKVIVLGGGHDWGYSPISALQKAGTVGFVNLDAHLDVRPSQVHHSGTPYWRAIENGVNGENAIWIGIQKAATARLHMDYATGHGGTIHFADDPIETERIENQIIQINETVDNLDLSLDLDVVLMSQAPGVSAPQCIGLQSEQVLHWIRFVKNLSKNRTFGIYELSPENDQNEMTARLAARFLWEYIS